MLGPRPSVRPRPLHPARLAPGLLAALIASACGAPAPVAPPPPGPVPTAAMPEPAVAPPPVAESPAPPPVPSSPFQKVGAVDEATAFARGPGSVYLAVGIDIVAIAEGDAVTLRPELSQAADFPYRVMSQLLAVTKGSGDEAWASWIFPEGRVGATVVERFDGKKWRRATRSRNGQSINQLFALGPSRVLAIEEAQMFPDDAPKILAASGPKAGLPQVSKRTVKNTTGAPSAVNLLFLPAAVVAGKDGGTQLVGNPFPLTEDEIVRPQYESFDANGKSKGHGELDLGLPDKSVSASVAATIAPGGPLLLTVSEGNGKTDKVSLRLLRGGTDKPEVVPVEGVTGVAGSAAADEKGELYLLTSGATTSLFRIGADGKARAIVLPPELAGASTSAMTVMAKNADDVWLFAPNAGKLDVYRTKPKAPPIAVELPNPQDAYYEKLAKAAAAREELVLATAYSKRCATPFVLLYTLAKTAPADYDFPATRDALKGHTELSAATFLEFSRGGKRFFGAAVPSGELGKKLVEAVKGKVAGSTPQLVCDAPTAERTLRIDLATGKIKP